MMLNRFIPRIVRKLNNRLLTQSSIIFNKKEYLPNEEWLLHSDKYTKVGISQSAKDQLDELVYLEFQFEPNNTVNKDDELVVLESVKATESINAPFDCVLVDNNTELDDNLESINNNPEDTWIVKIKKT